MKYNKFIKSTLFIGVVFIGVLFMLGCGQRADTFGDEGYGQYLARRNDKINKLDPTNRKKYDALSKKDGELIDQVIAAKEEFVSANTPTYTEIMGINRHNSRKKRLEKIDIKINQLNRQKELVEQEMEKMLNESTKTCFPKNTKIVMFDGSLKEIDTIKKGDKVMIYSITNDTIGESSVNKKFTSTNNHLYIINNSIKTTAYERFLTQDGWKRAYDITVGDTIFNGNSYVDVDSVYKVKKDLTVYNLNIKSTHNFFVSFGHDDEWFLIHNCGGEGGDSK